MRVAGVLKFIALFVAILVALLAVPLLFLSGDAQRPAEPAAGMPWQIDLLEAGHSRVFGLEPGRSNLDDARRLLGPDVQLALLIAPEETGSVEAYYDSLQLGMLTGKMVLTLETTVAQREDMLKRARKAEYMQGATRRIDLDQADRSAMANVPISAIAFIPSASLDEEIILQRFGKPAERLHSSEHIEHFLYPEKGLEVRLDANGKEVLQYVAPRDFARLRDPLVALGTMIEPRRKRD